MYWGDYIYHILAISGGMTVGGVASWLTTKITGKEKPLEDN
ncbi:hypothetical protein Q4S57_27625 [Priestia megaterium]|nr:hypothetical protein [Priestia megaterium]MDO6851617.1 hypothetical protein [Priestia megaterium]